MKSSKITQSHLNRKAMVYIRQSTMNQVMRNLESKQRQYGLRENAKELGFKEVEVIDNDLGRSGSGFEERPGFERMLVEVAKGAVGLILCVEVSRLARNSPDWARLIDLCSLLGTLVGDVQGIYDPKMPNDRLILGVKGTISEMELGQIKERMQAGLDQKAKRGELYNTVATGYIKTSKTTIAKDPNRRVQESFIQIFKDFERLGSAFGIYNFYQLHETKTPVRHGESIKWEDVSFSRVHSIITNPIYAGAYARGRVKTVVVVEKMKPVKKQERRSDPGSWDVLILDHHESYITWEQYLRNQEMLKQNAKKHSVASKGPVQKGEALLQGLIWCRRCGARLIVSYRGKGQKHITYHCPRHKGRQSNKSCLRFSALWIEKAVTQEVLRVVQPLGVTTALEAWDEYVKRQGERLEGIATELEDARYQADLRRRRYEKVDPANRLVADQLENDWESALKEEARIKEKLAQAEMELPPVSEQKRAQLLELGANLESLWNKSSTGPILKKKVIRSLIEQIWVDVDIKKDRIQVEIQWKGKMVTRVEVDKRTRPSSHKYLETTTLDMVRLLVKKFSDEDIVRHLNRLGLTTGRGNTWNEARLRSFRSKNKIKNTSKGKKYITISEAARKFDISMRQINALIKNQWLKSEQVLAKAPSLVKLTDLEDQQLLQQVQIIKTRGRISPQTQDQLSLFE